MKLKRMIAVVLTAATLCTMLVLPAGAASVGFSDVSDPTVARAAETLRLLGVINGDGTGRFNPGGTLTRAEFCKMAVMALDKGTEAEAQMNRTVFDDVLGDNWARGYIHVAASTPIGADGEGKGGNMLMMGVGDGTFRPGETIDYAGAVTVMMRILGYNDAAVASGATWYDGYLAAAKVAGLTKGLSLAPNDSITRGQMAVLFENMLYTSPKDGKKSYLEEKMGGTITQDAVILSLDATTADGTVGAVLLSGDMPPYKTNHAGFDKALEGQWAKLVLDKDGRVVAIEPSTAGSSRTVSILTTEATS